MAVNLKVLRVITNKFSNSKCTYTLSLNDYLQPVYEPDGVAKIEYLLGVDFA